MELSMGGAPRRVVVTGASRGVGRAVALACAREGAIVGLGYREREAEARAVEREIAAAGGPPAELLRFDVSDADAVAAAVARFVERHGRVDGWVNNAAVSLPGLLIDADLARVRAELDVNLLGPVLCARAVLPVMLAQRSGVIVNVGSVAAVSPSRGQAVYAATKGALEALTRALAVEYAKKGVRAVCVRPGPVDTAMLDGARALAEAELLGRVPLRRVATPADVAELVVFLLSDRASYVTGSVHPVDGGYA